MKIINFKKQKGISIVFIILVTSVIFAIALGMNSISVQQTKTMGEIGYSLVSFYAADSGAEKQLFDLFKATTHQALYDENISSDTSFVVKARCGRDMDPSSCDIGIPDPTCYDLSNPGLEINYCVNSVGRYKEIRRALELKY